MTSGTFVPKGGPRLHVDDAGGQGIPVVFQHGLCGDSRQTAEVFPPGTDYRRITLEARGHGASEPGDAAEFSMARFTNDLAELIESLELGPVIAGGISMGSAMTMRLAVTRPDLVRGLIIARPAWSVESAPANMAPNAEVGALLAHMTEDEARVAFAGSVTARRLSKEAPDNLASLLGFFSRKPQAVTSALLRSISADGPGVSIKQLQDITVPVLVIANRMDSVHPYELAEDVARFFPHGKLAEITPKSIDKSRYVTDFQNALSSFLKGFLQ
jgi:pimeloyl-ACP methyl ester carboxylesterase